ncbi:isoamylase early set domain-containing protein [Yinghuangia soli]|uniref:Isoamylase early set domain-containing protein n=1 Tax=Yinghuangia soli TaxID=2908204 RepID=A0AA41Q9X2_9ACTN|nr:isoamylase early set domain-containing protein [Yinghuangia soli]MCF2533962.1 isoamylase early set domain-containing protein [Yinghuangia soli]
MISTAKNNGATRVTFSLPADEPAGPVSVVGDFNEWQPGRHVLVRRSNGRRSVAVTLAPGETVRFRYLGENGVWFDDDTAEHDGENGVVTV